MTDICWVLLALVIFQQVYWTLQVQKLVNKLMSRDFFDYKTVLSQKPKEEMKITLDEPEDLRVLQEFEMR